MCCRSWSEGGIHDSDCNYHESKTSRYERTSEVYNSSKHGICCSGMFTGDGTHTVECRFFKGDLRLASPNKSSYTYNSPVNWARTETKANQADVRLSLQRDDLRASILMHVARTLNTGNTSCSFFIENNNEKGGEMIEAILATIKSTILRDKRVTQVTIMSKQCDLSRYVEVDVVLLAMNDFSFL